MLVYFTLTLSLNVLLYTLYSLVVTSMQAVYIVHNYIIIKDIDKARKLFGFVIKLSLDLFKSQQIFSLFQFLTKSRWPNQIKSQRALYRIVNIDDKLPICRLMYV